MLFLNLPNSAGKKDTFLKIVLNVPVFNVVLNWVLNWVKSESSKLFGTNMFETLNCFCSKLFSPIKQRGPNTTIAIVQKFCPKKIVVICCETIELNEDMQI